MAFMIPADWAFYEENGYLALGPILAPGAVASLVSRIEELMLGKLAYPEMLMQLDEGGEYDSMPPQTRGFKGARLDYRKIQDLEHICLV